MTTPLIPPQNPNSGESTQPTQSIEEKIAAEEAIKARLDELSKDFKRLQRQKARKMGGVEARVLKAMAFKWGEQYVEQNTRGLVISPPEENKLYLVFNFIDKAAAKLAGRLTAIEGQYYSRPDKKDPKALSEAEVVDKLIMALDEKLEQKTRTWEMVDTLLTCGVAFIHTPWIPDVATEPIPQFEGNELLFKFIPTGEIVPESGKDQLVNSGQVPPEQFEVNEEIELVGDVGCEVLTPLNVFVDQSVKSLTDLAPDQRVYIAKIKTFGWIEENYPGLVKEEDLTDELKIVTTPLFHEGDSVASMFLRDLIPTVQGERGEDDPKMGVVVHSYQPRSKSNPSGKYSCFIPNIKILYDGDNPYEDIPLVDFHFKPVTTTFWTKDFVTDLIAPQKFINKRMSQLGEQSNSAIYDKVLVGGTLAAKDFTPDAPQVVEKSLTEQGQPLAQRLPGAQLPNFFMESIDMVSKMMDKIAGAGLFEEKQFPGQMRGPMAIPFLQELLDTEWGPLFLHIGQQMAKVHQQRLNLVKTFYPPIRTLHYTDRDLRDEVLDFHSEDILKNGTNFNVTVERGSLLPEFKALREDRVNNRLSGPLSVLYLDERTGAIDKSKVADDLNIGEFGREGKESQSRKFARQIIEKLWQGLPVPPVLQFWHHEAMLDELEASMQTTEWLAASPQVQQLFIDRWTQHANMLQQRAQMQQQAMMAQSAQVAVAQATQQAAAMAASDTVNSVQNQMGAQKQAQQENPIEGQLAARRQPPGQNG